MRSICMAIRSGNVEEKKRKPHQKLALTAKAYEIPEIVCRRAKLMQTKQLCGKNDTI